MWSAYLQMCAFLAVGIYLGDRTSAGDAVIFIFALIIFSVFRKIISKKFFSFKTLAVLMAAVGILLYHYSIAESMRSAYPFQEKYVTMLGKITDLPRKDKETNSYIVDVRLINYLDENHIVHERVKVTSPQTFDFGDSVKIEGFLNPFSKKLNGGDFDSGRNYKAKGIYFRTYSDNIELCHTNFKIYSPIYFFTWIKSIISDKIYSRYDGDNAAILRAVLIGYKDSFSEELEDELYESNTMRLFYPAYIHISFLIMLVGLLSSYVSKSKRDIILIIMLLLYAASNFNTHYIVKSAAVLAALNYSKHKIGFSNYMDVLSLTVGIILITNPLIGYETGFLMSLSANILIYYFMPVVSDYLKIVRSKKAKRFLSLWIVTSVGMMPLQAYFFYVTTPYAFLLNLIYMPFLSILWIFMPFSLIFAPVLGAFNFFGMTVDGIMFFMRSLPGAISKLPGYSIPLPRPGILMITVFYLILFVLYRKFYKKKSNDFPTQLVCAVIIGFSVTSLLSFTEKLDNLQINFVNVGQGDGTVLSVPFHETVIIDGGGSSEYSDYDYGKEIFLPYLKREGYNRIDLAVVSHYHSDHCKGVIAAMKKLDVKEVLLPDCMEDNKYRIEMEQIAEYKNIKLSYYKAGARLKFKSGMVMDIISPDDSDLNYDNENDTSYGIRISYGNFSALFTGDLSAQVESRHKNEWGKCDILKVPHHGSATSSSEEFIREVSPGAAVISVGLNNSYALPNDKVLMRYIKNHIQIYRTDLHGDIVVSADKNKGYKINTFLEE